MNEQDENILELYLKEHRRKKIVCLIVAIFFVTVFLFYGFYARYKNSSNSVENPIQNEIENNIINENISNEENTSNI